MKVVLDTSFILIPKEFGVHIYSELKFMGFTEFIVPSPVLSELKKKKEKLALEVLEKQNYKVFPSKKQADAAVLSVAEQENAALATQDKALKRLAKDSNLRVVTLKGKSQLRMV